jgi:hypothetical protein
MSSRVAFFVLAAILIGFIGFSAYALFTYDDPECLIGIPGCIFLGAVLCDWLGDKLDNL